MRDVRTGQSMIRAALAAPYLGRDEEHQLAVSWKENRDQEAMHKIATAHMRLVISMAAKFRNFGLPMNDLIQEGHVGLLEAAARFEPDRDVRFSTYATWWIVRGGTSSAQKALFFNLRRLRAKLWGNHEDFSESAMHEEIALAVGVNVKDVAVMDARLSGSDTSLNSPVSDSESPGSDRIDFLRSEEPLPDEQVGIMIDNERRTK